MSFDLFPVGNFLEGAQRRKATSPVEPIRVVRCQRLAILRRHTGRSESAAIVVLYACSCRYSSKVDQSLALIV